MKHLIRRLINIIKAILIIIVFVFIVFYSVNSQAFYNEKQYFNLESATIISGGISVALCLVLYSRKNV